MVTTVFFSSFAATVMLLLMATRSAYAACSGSVTISSTSTSVSISDGPGLYDNGQSCTWRVRTYSPAYLKVINFATEYGYDTLVIRECDTGDLWWTLSGSYSDLPRRYNIPNGCADIEFTSDGSTTDDGFDMVLYDGNADSYAGHYDPPSFGSSTDDNGAGSSMDDTVVGSEYPRINYSDFSRVDYSAYASRYDTLFLRAMAVSSSVIFAGLWFAFNIFDWLGCRRASRRAYLPSKLQKLFESRPSNKASLLTWVGALASLQDISTDLAAIGVFDFWKCPTEETISTEALPLKFLEDWWYCNPACNLGSNTCVLPGEATPESTALVDALNLAWRCLVWNELLKCLAWILYRCKYGREPPTRGASSIALALADLSATNFFQQVSLVLCRAGPWASLQYRLWHGIFHKLIEVVLEVAPFAYLVSVTSALAGAVNGLGLITFALFIGSKVVGGVLLGPLQAEFTNLRHQICDDLLEALTSVKAAREPPAVGAPKEDPAAESQSQLAEDRLEVDSVGKDMNEDEPAAVAEVELTGVQVVCASADEH